MLGKQTIQVYIVIIMECQLLFLLPNCVVRLLVGFFVTFEAVKLNLSFSSDFAAEVFLLQGLSTLFVLSEAFVLIFNTCTMNMVLYYVCACFNHY